MVGAYPMKAPALLLAGSLVLNAALVIALTTRSAPPPPASASTTQQQPRATPPPANAIAASSPQTIRPEGLREADFRALANHLRGAGYSEEIVSNVIADVVGHHFKARRRALGLELGRDPLEFWRSPVVSNSAGTPEEIAGRRALDREQRELLRTLFGANFDVSEETRRRRGHGLPEDTAAKLNKIFADYREMEEQARDDAKSTADIAAKLDLLGREKRADIERLLTPEQLLEFDLRMGAGSALHNRLGQFEVSEAEFRALYAAQQAFNAANPGLRPRERSLQFEPELRRVLGETRYAELLGANSRADQQSREFVELRALVLEHNLSPSVASDVLRLQAQYQPQLRLVAQNSSLTPEQKESTRATLAAAARKELLHVLGPGAYEAYEKTRSSWLPPRSGPAPKEESPKNL